MNTVSLLLIGLSLAMDAFAISISNGVAYGGDKKQALLTAAAFGLAQGLMPMIGYYAGYSCADIIASFDHWLAFGLLAVIGGKMIFDGIRQLRSTAEPPPRRLTPRTLFLQAIATSIDALAIGVSFAALQVNIFKAAAIIAIVTFVCCVIGALGGKSWGGYLKKRAVLFGGVILVLLGVKILIEHLYF
ncbi:MAG: manganese efflux pump MntP family protein [Bacillota bacterium]|nr:manganese efflux pump MntP family protein [Bacillota bacterium]